MAQARKSIGIGSPLASLEGSGSTLNANYTVAAGNNRVLLVAAGAVDAVVGATVATGVTYGGVAMTLVDSQTSAAGNQDIGASLWILNNPLEGLNAVVVTFTGAVVGNCAIICAFTNVDQVTQQDLAATGTSGSGATTSSLSRTTVTDQALGVDICCTRLIQTHVEGAAPQALLTTSSATGGQDVTLSMSTELKAVAGATTMARTWDTSDVFTQSMLVLRPAPRRTFAS